MTGNLTFHDARRIVALLAQAPEGRLRLVDGDISVVAVIEGEARAPVIKDNTGTVTISSPAVGVFYKSENDDSIGSVKAPGRSVPVTCEHDAKDIETVVEDGAFVEYGTPIAIIRNNASD